MHVFNADNSDPNAAKEDFWFNEVKSISFWGNGGDDTLLYRGNSIGAQIRGNGGNDVITVVDSGTGASDVDGEAGTDTIIVSQAHNTKVSGGSGDDTIYVNADAKPVASVDENGVVTWSLAPSAASLASSICIVDAGSGNDTIVVYDGKVTINGGAGNDSVLNESLGQAQITTVKVESNTVQNPSL
ncbi:MAG TPA: hypothetical protein VF669_09005 [Tepidisphaeraceae bacterium]